MPKPVILVTGAVAAVVVVGGVVLLTNKKDEPATASSEATAQTASKETKLDDPDGTYNYFSDPSVTKFPEKNAEFGTGQTFTFEYDGTKTDNDPNATLSYQLYYIQEDGKVQPMGGGNLVGEGKGTFTVSDKVFNSSAKDRTGFFELIGTSGASFGGNGQISGKNTTLGMYPIKFQISE